MYAYASGGDCIGGIVAYANQNVKIDSCGNLGTVTCTADGDGFIGGILGYINNGNFKGISTCFNYGAIVTNEGKTAHAGAILGYNRNSGSVYSNNYYLDTSFTKAVSDNAIDDVYSMTAEQFRSGEVANKLGGAWKQTLGSDSYPNFTSTQSVYSYTNCLGNTIYTNESKTDGSHAYDANGFCKLDSTHYQPAVLSGSVYEISNLGQLLWFAAEVNNGGTSINGKLMVDIDATSVSYIGIGKDADHAFAGTFDGNNKTLKIALVSKEQYVAPFPYINGATISNLTVTGTIKTTHKFAASIVGRVLGGNVTLEKCLSFVAIDSNDYTGGDGTHGGLIGVVAAGTTTINNCGFAGSIIGETTTSCGGIVGWTDSNVKIGNSFVAATFTLQNNNGNTFGRNPSYISLDNCYYLNALSDASVATQMSADSFASGEVAYKLNGSKNAGAWKQTLGSDSSPNFTGKDVYYGYADCTATTLEYTNNKDVSTTKPAHSYDNGVCKVCGAYEPCEGEGTAEKPYLIKNAGNLYWFAAAVNGGSNTISGKLTADITVNSDVLKSDGTLNSGDFRAWTSIGSTSGNAYQGTFDGDNHTISGLYYNGTDDYVGLFGNVLNGAAVKNLTLTDSYISSESSTCTSIGGIAGYCTGSTIENCAVTNTVIKGTTTSTETDTVEAGGIVGYFNITGMVTRCTSSATVSASSTGNDAIVMAGGIVGRLIGGTVSLCVNSGEVSATGVSCIVGGVVGYSDIYDLGDLSSTAKDAIVTNCYNTGTVSGDNAGGVVFKNTSGTVTNCYYLGTSETDNFDGTTYKTEAQFTSGEVTYLLNGNSSAEDVVWKQTLDGKSYPGFTGDTVYRGYLSCAEDATPGFSNSKDVPTTKPEHTYSNGVCVVCKKECAHTTKEGGFCTVCGKSFAEPTLKDGVYEISTMAELYWFAQTVNSGRTDLNARLVADIVVNPGTFNADGTYNPGAGEAAGTKPREWTPICNIFYSTLYADFDGNNHTISGLYCRVENGYAGFIANMGAFTVKNLTIKNSYFEGKTAGAIAAYSDGATFTVCAVDKDVYVKGDEAGGLVGSAGGRIENCYSLATVSGKNYGGLVGSNYAAIENCYTSSMRPVGSSSSSYGGSMTNVYYAEDTTDYSKPDENGFTTVKPTFEGATEVKDFSNGKLAYTLQLNLEEAYRESTDLAPEIWKQTIDTDNYPNFTGKKVYRKINTGCYKNESEYYSNTENETYEAPHNYDNGFCTYCGGYQSAVKNDDGVYEIGNAGQLYWFAALVNGDFDSIGFDSSANAKLTADIVVNPGKFDEYGNYTPKASESLRMWTPIGKNNDGYKYIGTFDGAKNATENYTISGLYVNYSEESLIGLFAAVGAEENDGNLGTVKNVNIDNSYFRGLHGIGGIAGGNYYGNIVNCHNLGATVVALASGAGGIVGDCTGKVENCSNAASVSNSESETAKLGGIAGTALGGRSNSKIVNCTNSGTVSAKGDAVGGIVGYAYESSRIENCTNSGTVSGGSEVGGIVGTCGVPVKSCVNSGKISGTSYVGGIVGSNSQATDDTKKVSRCANSGDITGFTYVGGIMGGNFNALDNCKNTGKITGNDTVGGVVGRNDSSVSASFSTGLITITGYDKTNAGGIAGFATSTGSFDNCYYLDESATVSVGGASAVYTGTAVIYASAFASG